MTLNVSNIGDNPQQPSITADAYIPDQLIASNLKLVTQPITLDAGTLSRGTVLGQKTMGAATATAGTNTGNGTCSAVTLDKNAQAGDYVVRLLSATDFYVEDPVGNRLQEGTVGTAYDDQVKFTLTAGGTAFAAGDTFTIAVAAGDGNYVECVATATDGSQYPCAILADAADASGGAVATGAYVMGEFNQNAIIYDASWTLSALTTALRKNAPGIFLKSFVSAADPT